LDSFSDDYLAIKDGLDLLESQVSISPSVRANLEKEQDIGLILAIIEALD
jgi:hypothetical protein